MSAVLGNRASASRFPDRSYDRNWPEARIREHARKRPYGAATNHSQFPATSILGLPEKTSALVYIHDRQEFVDGCSGRRWIIAMPLEAGPQQLLTRSPTGIPP